MSIFASSTQAHAQLERSLADIPTAFRFHGITPEQLKEIGVTPEEFAYLVANFSAGHIFHFGILNNTEPFERDGYRYTMLKTQATRKAWPLIKRMIAPGKYGDKIEATIKAIEAEEAARINELGSFSEKASQHQSIMREQQGETTGS